MEKRWDLKDMVTNGYEKSDIDRNHKNDSQAWVTKGY